MIDLERFKHRTQGKFIVRKVVDDSGDYIRDTYDILARYPWGNNLLCSGIENPYDATMWAAAPDLIEELRVAREQIAEYEKYLEGIPYISKLIKVGKNKDD